jgi:hypothetical protein
MVTVVIGDKKLFINKSKFSKDKLSLGYSPSNLGQGPVNSRVQILKKKGDFAKHKQTIKAYSNSPDSFKNNYNNHLGKQSLGFRRGSNNLNISSNSNSRIGSGSIKFNFQPNGASTTKGKKKISFLNQKSTRETLKKEKWSKAPNVNLVQSIKLDDSKDREKANPSII